MGAIGRYQSLRFFYGDPAPMGDFFCQPAEAADSEIVSLDLKMSQESKYPNLVAVLNETRKGLWFGLLCSPKAKIRKTDKLKVFWFKQELNCRFFYRLCIKNNGERWIGEVQGSQVLAALKTDVNVHSFHIKKTFYDEIFAKAFL